VALSNIFPEARSVRQWLRQGWHIPVAYVIGFFVMLGVWKWHPDLPHTPGTNPIASEQSSAAS
jgi:hypothetical protein